MAINATKQGVMQLEGKTVIDGKLQSLNGGIKDGCIYDFPTNPKFYLKFTNPEMDNGFIDPKTGKQVNGEEILTRLKNAGLDSMPGGGAELFHPEIRNKFVRGKCTGQEWLDTMEEAHNIGIKSNATMLYGHIEKPKHVVDHLIKIRELQKKTNGFITLIPLNFSLENTELEK